MNPFFTSWLLLDDAGIVRAANSFLFTRPIYGRIEPAGRYFIEELRFRGGLAARGGGPGRASMTTVFWAYRASRKRERPRSLQRRKRGPWTAEGIVMPLEPLNWPLSTPRPLTSVTHQIIRE